jgi:RNA polymerase sigma factor (sigma-70 family)
MVKPKRRITKAYFYKALRQYEPLVQKLVFQIAMHPAQVEDFRAQAADELLKCMVCYNRSGSFITFFHGRLAGVLKHMRDVEQRARRVEFVPIDSFISLATWDGDQNRGMMIQEGMACLTDQEREVITQIFFDQKTMREISASSGLVLSTVFHIKDKAINKMRQKFRVGQE